MVDYNDTGNVETISHVHIGVFDICLFLFQRVALKCAALIRILSSPGPSFSPYIISGLLWWYFNVTLWHHQQMKFTLWVLVALIYWWLYSLWLRALSYNSDATLSQTFQPMTAQLSMKAELPLAKILATASCRSSKTGPSDPIWWHRSGSTLAQVMRLTAPSLYLNQCWLTMSEAHWQSLMVNFTRDTVAINYWIGQA